jgi:hypothetical protein
VGQETRRATCGIARDFATQATIAETLLALARHHRYEVSFRHDADEGPSSTTGRQPIFRSIKTRAASTRGKSGVVVITSLLITSFTSRVSKTFRLACARANAPRKRSRWLTIHTRYSDSSSSTGRWRIRPSCIMSSANVSLSFRLRVATSWLMISSHLGRCSSRVL